ncbi:glycosyltransferase family 4 protein [Roseateles sp. GG27B]
MSEFTTAKRSRLLVVQRRLTHYRVPFFEGVRAQLAAADVDLTLAVGDPTVAELNKRDEGHLDWAVHVPCTYALGGRLCWQSLGPQLPKHDMVVVTQENKLLNNLPLLLGNQNCRVGLWGHGQNFQAAGSRTAGVAQHLKAALSRKADWWFAYTDVSAEIVRDFGYPAARITVLNNAIDTAGLAAAVALARRRGRDELRATFGLASGGPLGLYLGSLYPEKRLDLLIDGAVAVQRVHPDFQLAVVGAGPQEAWLRARVAGLPWVHVLGSRQGAEKAELLACADVMLNPGLVGLGILDAFVAGLPLVTTDCHLHSPEIAYLQPGNNGLMTAPDAASFAAALVQIIGSPTLADHLRQGCVQSAVAYSMDAMVDRFCTGVLAWKGSERLSKLPSLDGAR